MTDSKTLNKPRKQARQARSRATQEAVLEAAARILETQGAQNLNTNAIAELAGVSVGSLYQYFPNKEAILATIMRNKRRDLLENMRKALHETKQASAEDAVDAVMRAGLMHQFARPTLAMRLEYLEPQLGLKDESAELSTQMAELIISVARRIQPDAGPEEARDIVAVCKGIINSAALAGEPGGEALFRRCHRAVLGYLRQSRSD